MDPEHGALAPRAPCEPRALTSPAKMAMVTVLPLNSFAVTVNWTKPLDVYSRKSRSAMALARNKSLSGLLSDTAVKDLPVVGYRLRFWSISSAEEGRLLQSHYDVGHACRQIRGEPELLPETWSPEVSSAVLKWLVPGKTYVFQVMAFNSAGEGEWSEASMPFLMPERPDGLGMELEEASPEQITDVPARPAHLSKSMNAIEIAWNRPCDRGSEIESYEFLISQDPKFPKHDTRQIKVDGKSASLEMDGLTPNQVYYVTHRAHNDQGPSEWSETTLGIATRSRAPERPEAPVRVDVATGPREVVIRWEHPESYNIPVQHYKVRSSMSPDMSDFVEVLLGDVKGAQSGELMEEEAPPTTGHKRFARGSFALTQMKVKGLRPSTTYYFQVQACNQIGVSEWSHVSQPMKMGSCAPEKCEKPNYLVGNVTEGMSIYWQVPDTYGEGEVTRYDVRLSQHAMMKEHRYVENVPFRKAEVLALPGESLVQTTIQNCWGPTIDQFFQVRAWSSAGRGPWSDSSHAMQVDPVRPFKPEPPDRFEFLPCSLVVHWTPSESPGCDVVRHELRYAETRDMSRCCEIKRIKGEKTTYVVTSLQPGKKYFFQVRCWNAMGCSDWSEPSRPVEVKKDVPSKMSAPLLLEKSAKHINVSFQPPADLGTFDGDLVTSYSIFYACGPECEKLLESGEDSVKILRGVRPASTVIDGLQPGSEIAVQVFSSNHFGDGPLSNISAFKTLPSEPEAPHAPTSDAAERTSWSTFISVLPRYDGGCPVDRFGFEIKDLGTGEVMKTPVWGTNPPDERGYYFYCINTLRPGHTYCFRAYAQNDVGPSEWSEWSAGLETHPFTPDTPTTPPVLSDPDPYNFTATWDDIEGNGAPVTDWVLQWSVDPQFSSKNTIREVTVHQERTWRCNRCLPGIKMHVRVAGINSEGRSHFGPTASIKTLYDKPVRCAPPHVTHSSITSLRLSWMHPHNGGSELTNFWLRWWETDAGGRPESMRDCGEMMVKGKRRFILVDQLQSRRTYQFQLAAENIMGLGEYSEASRPARTSDPLLPAAPGKPICMRGSFNTITMVWNASESIGTECTAQVVQISHDPTFPASLTGQAWLPPFKEKQRKDITADITFRTPQAFAVGPSKRPGWKELDQASVNPRSSWMKYGGVQISMSDWTPPEELRGADEAALREAWQTEVFHSIFAAESTARIASAMLESRVKDRLEILAHTPPRFTAYPAMKEAMARELSKEELERKRSEIRRGVYTGEPGFKSLVDQLREKNATPTPPANANKYNLVGMQPGTYYYARVASVNEMGISDWGPVSLPSPSGAYPPSPIPQDPGIELLRVGCTSLSFGWKRPYCGGAPVTHYVVRFAQTAEALQQEDCYEFTLDETEIETWPGMVHEEAASMNVVKEYLENEEVIGLFAEYLMTRFGGVEESWEWLDINGNGEVCKDEFIQGDLDTGPPFADFSKPELLDQVWDLLDRDGTSSISINEYTKLRPYMEAVKRGQAGLRYDGFYCMVPSLTPGKSYYIMARPCNSRGTAEWTHCLVDPITTLATTPPRMEAVESVPERRSPQNITLRWKVPWGNGDVIRRIEILWAFQDLEEGNVEYQTLIQRGKKEVFEQDPTTGELQTEFLLPKLQPGQIVAAVARPFNGIGGARLWSPMPGPGSGRHEELWTWDICTIATEADIPGTVIIDEASLRSEGYTSHGEFSFEIGARTNGRHILSFEFKILNEKLEVVQEFDMEVSPEESNRLRKSTDKSVRGSFAQLEPGEKYCVQVRVINAVGPSHWAEPGPFARMPPDVPFTPAAVNSELTSLNFIEVKWKPPHESGADIEKYQIRMALRANPIEEEWIIIDEDLEKNTKIQGEGKRLTSRDKGSYAYRVHGLNHGTLYYFAVRARNCVGWSPWSEVARFMTKNSKPPKLQEISQSTTTSREIEVTWTAPESSVELLRTDLVGGPNERLLRWCQFACFLLDHTEDVDKLFGFAIKEDAEPEVAKGIEAFGDLYCEESMYVPVLAPKNRFTLSKLLPGQDYYFMARVVSTSGKGEFSQVLGPCRTSSEEPNELEPMELVGLENNTSCSASFRLPYNMGARISEIHAVLHRLRGPLSDDELEDGAAKAHVAGQELKADPSDLIFHSVRAEAVKQRGVTPALRQCFVAEALPKELPKQTERISTLASCTGQSYKVSFHGLRPGTDYEVRWRCQNEMGQSPLSGGLVFKTQPHRPDRPPPCAVDSL